MIKTIHGKVHGKTIELDEDLCVPEGQDVIVQVKWIAQTNRIPGEGFQSTEGSLANDEEWDEIMEEIHQARKKERRIPVPDLEKI
ncbi:MAG: hypothetical protein WCO91_12745 [Gemmataceae bacterium]